MMDRTLIVVLAISLAACQGERERTEPTSSTPTETLASDEPPNVGESMPAYVAVRLDGSTFDVANEKGKVTLLNIWATWCGPCRYEIPELEALHRAHAPRGFQVVGVSIDNVDSVSAVRSFVADRKISYPIVLDPQGHLTTMFQTVAIPMSILVDRQGTIVWVKYGIVRSDDPKLRAAIAAAL